MFRQFKKIEILQINFWNSVQTKYKPLFENQCSITSFELFEYVEFKQLIASTKNSKI